MISIKNNQKVILFSVNEYRKKAEIILQYLGYQVFDLGIQLTTDRTMQKYNYQFRKQNNPTDVLSFPYHTELKAGERIVPKDEDDKNVGDIMLCPEYIKTDLPNWEQSFEHRMRVLLVHAICHLLGYDHETDADHEVMQTLEDSLLEKLERQH